jgi:membrane fusion protein, multidrug efflux system
MYIFTETIETPIGMMKRGLMRKMTFILLCLALFACEKDKNSEIQKRPTIPSQGIGVDMGIAQHGDLYETIETNAVCRASEKGIIESKVSAIVQEIHVQNGQKLAKGDTLFILDAEAFRNEWATVHSKFIKAISDLILELETKDMDGEAAQWSGYLKSIDRQNCSTKALPEHGDSRLTVIMARLDILTLFQQIRSFEKQIGHCIIRAPFPGMISDLEIYTGASVQAGQSLCRLTNLSAMHLLVSILENELPSIRIGAEIEILGEVRQKTVIQSILPLIDPERHTGTALATIENAQNHWKDGQTLRVKVEKGIYRERIYIPRSAMLSRNDRDLVFLVKDGIAKWQYVSTGFGNSEAIEIVSGLNAGDTIITGGHYSLGHNVKVFQRSN